MHILIVDRLPVTKTVIDRRFGEVRRVFQDFYSPSLDQTLTIMKVPISWDLILVCDPIEFADLSQAACQALPAMVELRKHRNANRVHLVRHRSDLLDHIGRFILSPDMYQRIVANKTPSVEDMCGPFRI